MVSSKTLENNADTSYDTKISSQTSSQNRTPISLRFFSWLIECTRAFGGFGPFHSNKVHGHKVQELRFLWDRFPTQVQFWTSLGGYDEKLFVVKIQKLKQADISMLP